MKMTTSAVTQAVFFSLVVAVSAQEYLRVCYYSNWSQYRPGIGKFMPSDIDPNLCTHLIYAFAILDYKYELTTFEWNDETLYQQFNNLRQGRDLKTLIAVGGWNFGSEPFSIMVTDSALRSKFVRTSVQFVKKHGFDGLDLDWEYPAQRGGASTDKESFVKLVQDLRAAFDVEHPHLLLTAAVPAGKSNIDDGYNVTELDSNFDFMNLMSYDLHGAWENFTGFNSPLYGRTGEVDGQEKLNVKWAADYWVSKGASPQKLIIGLATYGRTFTLSDANNYYPGAKAKGPGTAGSYSREPGFLAYYEICSKISGHSSKRYWEPEHRVPYYVTGDQWIGYDDIPSLTEKVEWLKSSGFGGAMIWNIDMDDFNRSCPLSTRRYPLMNTIKEVLAGENPTTISTTATTTISSTSASDSTVAHFTTTTPTNPPTDFCDGKADGFYSDPLSCSAFYQCAGGSTWRKTCAPGLMWNQKRQACDWPQNVDCTKITTSTTTETTASATTETTTSTTTGRITSTTTGTTTGTTTSTTTEGTTTETPTSTTTEGTTPVHDDFCVAKQSGFYADPGDCSMYYQCWMDQTYHMPCAKSLYWSQAIQVCDFHTNVNCSIGSLTSTSTNHTTTDQPITYQLTTSSRPQLNSTTAPKFDPDFCIGQTDGIHKNMDDCSGYYNCHTGSTYHYNCISGYLFDALVVACREAHLVDCSNTMNESGFCKGKHGYFPYPKDCQKYYHCGGSTTLVQTCTPPLLYDADKKKCDRYPDCQGRRVPGATNNNRHG